jgi:hypothetical protein
LAARLPTAALLDLAAAALEVDEEEVVVFEAAPVRAADVERVPLPAAVALEEEVITVELDRADEVVLTRVLLEVAVYAVPVDKVRVLVEVERPLEVDVAEPEVALVVLAPVMWNE